MGKNKKKNGELCFAKLSKGSSAATFTPSSMVTTVGNTGGGRP